ncbi:MAG: HAMP domain-containing sensor histidine kinase [Candidatus Eisenbacteria bacterium]
MVRHRLSQYLGILFIGVVIVPAVVLGLLAIRSIGREEVYIERQLERTLSAEVDHVSTRITTEIAGVQSELAGTASVSFGKNPADSLELWKMRSSLVDIPFLLSPDYEILWPAPDRQAGARESDFIDKQQAFLRGEAEVPIYENIAVAYKEDIVGDEVRVAGSEETTTVVALTGELSQHEQVQRAEAPIAEKEQPVGASVSMQSERPPVAGVTAKGDRAAVERTTSEIGSGERPSAKVLPQDALMSGTQATGAGLPPASDKATTQEPAMGEQSLRQTAISEFQQSEPVRKKVYEKAATEGQQISYRNVEPVLDQGKEDLESGTPQLQVPNDETKAHHEVTKLRKDVAARPVRSATIRSEDRKALEQAERLRSIFISQPLKFSEIVARGQSGIIPLTADGQLRLLYWQKLSTGNIVGCLVAAQQFRERIIGALPGIYSPSRILTVLDEKGQPLIVPPGQASRDWRRPFVAQEISEALPGWEVAAYLTDPGVISSRARTTTVVMWVLVFIMFVSIVTGGMLVVRSASAELKLAQQKTTFVANVSHELKTPLTSIRMFAEMLREGRQPDEAKRMQYLDIMKAETERLTRLINNVLDFSRMEQDKKRYTMKPCDLVALAASTVESQRASLENKGFTITLRAACEHALVHADEEAIKQALVNLLSNAEKYSDASKEIEVSVGREDGKAVIGVSDRGIGIPAGEAEKIFAEFYRVDDALTSRVKGTGLGLTIARRIARDHKGDITYSGREGGGSTFKIVLPLIEDTP